MKFKSKLKRWIAAGVAGVMMGVIGGFLPGLAPEVGAPMTVEAYSYNGAIENNGLGDIYIDISKPPYSEMKNGTEYGPEGCAWFTSARVKELTGKGNKIFGSANWWEIYGPSYGFTQTQTPTAPAIICWGGNQYNTAGHVAILEKIEGDTAYISEGGFQGGAAHSYCRIHTVSVSAIKNAAQYGVKENDGKYHYYPLPFTGYLSLGVPVVTIPEGHVMTKEEAAGQSLPDGDYWIRSELKDTSYVSVASNANTMYGTVCIKNYTGTPSDSDLFHITYQKDGFYRMKHLGTGNEVTLSGGDLKGSANVEIWPSLDTPTIQEWSLERAENGYKIRSRGNNFYCDVQGALTDTGTNIVTWSAVDTPSQQAFRFIPKSTGRTVEDGDYWIKAYHSGNSYLYADAGNENAHYENICLKNSNELPDKNEAYRITYQKNGYYKIMHIGTGRYLTVSGGSTKMGVNVETWEVLSGSLQDWLIDETSNGIKFRSACNGEYLDITGGEFKTGTNIRMWKGVAQKAQSFALIEASAYSPGDINADGALDVNDVVLLQKWILKVKKTTLKDADAADMNSDGVIDIYDLALLKRKLLQKK